MPEPPKTIRIPLWVLEEIVMDYEGSAWLASLPRDFTTRGGNTIRATASETEKGTLYIDFEINPGD